MQKVQRAAERAGEAISKTQTAGESSRQRNLAAPRIMVGNEENRRDLWNKRNVKDMAHFENGQD